MEIAPGIHQVEGTRVANVFLLVGERLTLVDTSTRGSSAAVGRYVRRLGREPHEIDQVVLTHHHMDHVGGLAELRRSHPVIVAAHEADIPYIEGKLPQPGPRLWGPLGLLAGLARPFFQTEPSPVDLALQDGSHLDLLGGLQVIHTPGHTPGSICLYFPEVRTLLVGDVVRYSGRRLSPAIPVFTQDIAAARRSVLRLTDLPVETIGFGHGPTMREGSAAALHQLASQIVS